MSSEFTTIKFESGALSSYCLPSISCPTALKTMAEKVGNAFKALRDLFFSQKSEGENPWTKALANGKEWVDKTLALDTASGKSPSKGVVPTTPPVTVTTQLVIPITNGESGTAASGTLDLLENKPPENDDDDGVVYRPVGDDDDVVYRPAESPRAITLPVASVILSPKETKSSTTTPKSGMAVDRVTNPKETLEYLQKVRSDANANKVKRLMEKNAERERVQKILDAPLTKSENSYLRTLPGKRTENETIIRQARFPETKQLWESRISISQWVPDLQDWCIDNNVNIDELNKWKRCFPPS